MSHQSFEFREFGLDDGKQEAGRVEINQTHLYRQVPDSPVRDDVPLHKDSPSESFWTFEYYQQFFNVDTEQVKSRILWGMIPRPGINYIHNCIQPNPDLYGPFWICVTLMFTIAISGNVVNYFHFAPTGQYEWKYDFHIISYAATSIFTYACLVPLGLWFFVKSNECSQYPLTFLELLCVYGYSMGIYVPVSILWAVPIPWLQWTLVFLGAAMSGFVLVTSVSPSLYGPRKILILAVMIGLHFLLATGFMLYFFHVPDMSASLTDKTPATNEVLKHVTNETKPEKI